MRERKFPLLQRMRVANGVYNATYMLPQIDDIKRAFGLYRSQRSLTHELNRAALTWHME